LSGHLERNENVERRLSVSSRAFEVGTAGKLRSQSGFQKELSHRMVNNTRWNSEYQFHALRHRTGSEFHEDSSHGKTLSDPGISHFAIP
jgi:hypothetical protein